MPPKLILSIIIIAQPAGKYGIIYNERGDSCMHYHVGDIVEGVITGIQPYGAFVHLDEQHNGLIHISEISSGYVREVANFVKLHEKVRVKVLDVSDEHLKLSLKAIQPKAKRSRRDLRNYKVEEMTIGFSTLEQHLNEWIKQALKEDIQ